MNVLVIDALGGGVGKQLVSALKKNMPELYVTAVGGNSIATTAMMKGNPDVVATGENAVIVACRKADVIIGPVGIVIADSMFGEITPKMALAVGQSRAKRILLPMNHCDNTIVGVPDSNIGHLVTMAVDELSAYLKQSSCSIDR